MPSMIEKYLPEIEIWMKEDTEVGLSEISRRILKKYGEFISVENLFAYFNLHKITYNRATRAPLFNARQKALMKKQKYEQGMSYKEMIAYWKITKRSLWNYLNDKHKHKF